MSLTDLKAKLESLLAYEQIYGSTLSEFDRTLLEENKARLERQIKAATEDLSE